MRALKRYAPVVLFVLFACGGDDAAGTEVAIHNGGTNTIDATISDGETELTFDNVAAGTTSGYKATKFGSLTALTVTVGSETSMLDLDSGARSVVTIGADGTVEGVVAVHSGGGNDGW